DDGQRNDGRCPTIEHRRARWLSRSLQVQRQQPAQDLVIGHLGRVVGPAVGGGHRSVQRLVCAVEPRRAQVVEVGQLTP
ncbi:MAG TPA: hypothetical protein PK999_15950, partial [Nitrospira sp.]|nr:hypothetical protein [Nitrospira sp.]